MDIYIASSWKNQHAVVMLTALLREKGHYVKSFIEAATNVEIKSKSDIDQWIESVDGLKKFDYDTSGAMDSDVIIYISPSGTDAWAEIGIAWAAGKHILGLYAKGEQAGLMRLMVDWFDSVEDLLKRVDVISNSIGE